MDTATDTKTQITKAWGMGLPTRPGRYILCNADYSNARIRNAVEIEPGTVAVFENGTQVALTTDLRHFGPLPSIERSIAAQERKSS